MINYQELYNRSLTEFALSLTDGRFPRASRLDSSQRKEAVRIDPALVKGVRDFLPHFLPMSATPSNVADSMTGVIFLREINAPEWIAFHFHRGLYAAVLRMSYPPEIQSVLTSVNGRGYPTEPYLSRHFKKPPRTCGGMLSGLETLRILSEDIESTSRVLAYMED